MKKAASKTTKRPAFTIKLTPNKIALFDFGATKQPSWLQTQYAKHTTLVNSLWLLVLAAFVVFSVLKNTLYLFAIPFVGFLLFNKYQFHYMWAWLKVFVFKRSYYKDRRELFKINCLVQHLKHKKAKHYKGGVVIWDNSAKLLAKNVKYNHLQKNKGLIPKEYIKS